ncbi:unnamed protein product [Trifolium pratense]|uniref:Uncharacterized protein n=1 Tax=Trifolium pratense TaxID=57577 RepID=A0ACB0JCJ8_TRIPR|nr:unnamed protein product [Trifolium pratense]
MPMKWLTLSCMMGDGAILIVEPNWYFTSRNNNINDQDSGELWVCLNELNHPLV